MKALITVFFLLFTFASYSQVERGEDMRSSSSTDTWAAYSDRRIPAEWEELQAVVISWPYLRYTEKDNPKEVAETFKKMYTVWTSLASSIQNECEVWIRIYSAKDSINIKTIMQQAGTPLKRYKFLVYPGESFWVRDYGPVSFYYGKNDSIGMIDAHYHRSQAAINHDDEFPGVVADQLNAPLIRTPLVYEFGNLDTDGWGNGFFTSRIYQANINQNNWNKPTINDAVRSVFNLKSGTELSDLHCDGGTGHVDMFFKMLDEQTIVLTEYPAGITTSDKRILEENFLKIKALKSVYGTPYKIVRIPLPTSDNGKYESTDCEQLNLNPRGYINGFFVNKSYILPIYSDKVSGNSTQDAKVIDTFKKLLSGYKIVPIDSRFITFLAGGIHCTTMQIPAENPLRFLLKEFPNTTASIAPSYPITVEISNKDGITSAFVEYRKKGKNKWQYNSLESEDGRTFTGKIDGVNNNYRAGDTVEYYFKAESNNGKIMTKPMTAPEGYYSFVITDPAGVITENSNGLRSKLPLRISPIPASEAATICFTLEQQEKITVTIYDMGGNAVETLCNQQNLDPGAHTFTFVSESYPSGLYSCTIATDEKVLKVRKFYVQH